MMVRHAIAQNMTPLPAIQPSSATALKSASIVAKKARAVEIAAVSMLGPARSAVNRIASSIERPSRRASS